MLLWSDDRIYFWMQFSRVFGKAGPHKFFACTGTDAETTGRFCDSVTRVGFATVFPGQTTAEVFELYKSEVMRDAEQAGFTNNKIVTIRRRDYQAFLREFATKAEEFAEQFYGKAYEGKVRR